MQFEQEMHRSHVDPIHEGSNKEDIQVGFKHGIESQINYTGS